MCIRDSSIVCPFLGKARFPPGSFFLFRTLSLQQRRRTMVAKDRIKGSAEQAQGKVKEVAGKLPETANSRAKAKATRSRARSEMPLAALKTRFGASDTRRLSTAS